MQATNAFRFREAFLSGDGLVWKIEVVTGIWLRNFTGFSFAEGLCRFEWATSLLDAEERCWRMAGARGLVQK